jgi:hypothetical protein
MDSQGEFRLAPTMSEAEKPRERDGPDFDRNGVPILAAYDVGNGRQWVVWCDYCVHWHAHSRGEGDRAAHCFDRSSPYRLTGYVLRRAGVMTDELRKSTRRSERAARRRQSRSTP